MLQSKPLPYQVFLHLMMMVMFYVSIISLVALLVEYINLLFPDQLISYGWSYDNIRTSSSILVVAFPVFLITTWLVRQAFQEHPDERRLGIRRWLIYLTLFVAGITMVVDLIQFVNGFYSGELTLPFFLKLLIVLILSLLTFAYFLWDLKETNIQVHARKWLAGVSLFSILSILGFGFILAGSPAYQRAVRFDEQRISDLQSIQYEVGNYWHQKDALPEQLSDLERDLYAFQVPIDPKTQEPYGYSITGLLSFQLCASFEETYRSVPNSTLPEEQWFHERGQVCFDRTIDPDLFEKSV